MNKILTEEEVHTLVERHTANVEPIHDLVRATEQALLNHSAIPKDWQLAPKKPTERMVASGFEAASEFEDTDEYKNLSGCQGAFKRAQICYDAMLEAAPTPPVGSDQ